MSRRLGAVCSALGASALHSARMLLLWILSAFGILKKIHWVPVNLKPLWSLMSQLPCPPHGGHEQRPQGPRKLPVTDVRETRCPSMFTQQMPDEGSGLLDVKALTAPRPQSLQFL